MGTPSKPRITFGRFDALVPLSELKGSRHQRNIHPPEQIERLAKIMREHGVRHPIHVSNLSGEVCFGHGRWAAAKLNGWAGMPVVYQDFKDAQEEYACVQSDNAIAHWAELDLGAITKDLPSFPDLDLDLLGLPDLDLPADPAPEAAPTESMTMLECPHCLKQFEQGQARTVEV